MEMKLSSQLILNAVKPLNIQVVECLIAVELIIGKFFQQTDLVCPKSLF